MFKMITRKNFGTILFKKAFNLLKKKQRFVKINYKQK